MLPHVRILLALTLLSGSLPALAQDPPCSVTTPGDPTCLGPNLDDNDSQYLWAGEMRHVFTLPVGSNEHTWLVGDGGQIRHRFGDPAQAGLWQWELQDTPDDFRTQLLDVFFLNQEVGWACGWEGKILKTTNGGASWDYHPGGTVFNCWAEPAVLWRSRFVNQNLGFTCGLWTFKRWDGSQWTNVELSDKSGGTVLPGHVEFYGLDILSLPEGWIGVASGELVDASGHCVVEGGEPDSRGVVFYTDSRDPQYNNGATWKMTFDQDEHPGALINDPWDIEYAPGATSLDGATVFVAGGWGNDDGWIFRSDDGGDPAADDWEVELGDVVHSPTLYGIAALKDGKAMACGYAGTIWTRDPAPLPGCPAWRQAKPPVAAPLADAYRSKGNGGDNDCFVVGSFGFVRQTLDVLPACPPPCIPCSPPKPTWANRNPGAPIGVVELFRLEDIWFLNEDCGFAVGQHEAIAATSDGGCSWEATKSDDDEANGPPSGPGGKLWGLAFSPDDSLGVAVGRANLADSGNPDPSYPSYLYDTSTTHTWNTFWSGVAIDPLAVPAGTVQVELKSAAWVNDSFLAVGTRTDGSGTIFPLVLKGETPAPGVLNWVDVTPPISSNFPQSLRLLDVVFLNPNAGVAVGYSGSSTCRAYYIETTPAVTFTPIGVTPVVGKLTGVAANGPDPALDDIIAVRSPARVFKFSTQGVAGTAGTFSTMSPAPPASSYGYTSVAMFGDTILVGQETLMEEALTASAGRLLRFDGTSWAELKSLTCKLIPSVFLLNESTGWYLADGTVLDSEFGGMGDSTVLYYSDTP